MGAGASMQEYDGKCKADWACQQKITDKPTGFFVPHGISSRTSPSAILDVAGNVAFMAKPIGCEIHMFDAADNSKVAVVRPALKSGMMGQKRYEIVTTKPTQQKNEGFMASGYKPAASAGRDASGTEIFMFAQVQKNMMTVTVPSFTFWVERSKGMLGGTNEFELNTDMSMFSGFSFPLYFSELKQSGRRNKTEKTNVAAVGMSKLILAAKVSQGMYTVECAANSDALGLICFAIAVNEMMPEHQQKPAFTQAVANCVAPVPVAATVAASAPVATAPAASSSIAVVAAHQVQVTYIVPASTSPDTKLQITYLGRAINVVVPDGAVPGQQISLVVPTD